MEFISPMPFDEAIDKLDRQTVVGSTLSAGEWSDLPVDLRENAFFSSRVESARVLQRAKDALGDFLTGSRVAPDNSEPRLATGSRAAFVSQMQQFLEDEGIRRTTGDVKDITSEKRLGLIFDVKTRQAQDFGYWKQGMNPLVLNEFPAQKFIRVRDVKTEREGHIPFQDQVYLKTDPTWWLEINRDFGVPWGPWGWGCGHDVEDVDRTEAQASGLLKPGQRLQPLQRSLNHNLQASIARLDPDLVEKLKQVFGRKIVIEGDTIRWAAGMPTADVPTPPPVRTSPVSDAVTMQVFGSLKRQAQAGLDAIDLVHDDGALPPIPLFDTDSDEYGFLMPMKTAAGMGTEYVAVRGTGPWPALTTVHEMGHFLDVGAIGPVGRMATLAGDPDMAAVLAVVQKTASIKALEELRDNARNHRELQHYNYLLQPFEIWARAYAQFITEKSGSRVLQADLQRLLARDPNRQWTTEDFALVAQAIEALFKKLGWL
jgi:hypothetical protein